MVTPTTITPLEIPVPSNPLSALNAAVTIAKVAGVDLPGLNDVAGRIGSFFGGGGHSVRTAGLNVPESASDLGIIVSPINASSYRHFGARAQQITGSVINAMQSLSDRAVSLGVAEDHNVFPEFADLVNAVGYAARATVGNEEGIPSSPTDLMNRNQRAVDVIGLLATSLDALEVARAGYLKAEPEKAGFLNSLISENPTEKQAITHNYWRLLSDNDNPGSLTILSNLTSKTRPQITSNILGSDIVEAVPVVVSPLPVVERTPLIPPVNVTVNLPPQTTTSGIMKSGQSTLGQQTNILNPTQPANPQNKSNWWNKLITAGRVASGVHTAIQLPFFISGLFSEEEPVDPFLFEEGSQGDEFFNFPEFSNDEQGLNQALLSGLINPLNGNISLKTLDTPRQGLFSISTITSYAPYLAMGLIAAYLLAKKRA